jgi:hypothetical protein
MRVQHVSRFGTLAGFACQICAAGAAVIWPDQKWIGWSLFIFGGITLIATFIWWLRVNKAHLRDWVKRVEPVHVIALGLVIAAGGVIWMLYRAPANAPASATTEIQLGPAPAREGSPIAWNKAPRLGWHKDTEGRIFARSLTVLGENVSKEEVQFTDAFITSGITGQKITLTILADKRDGTRNSDVAVSDVNPIPPNAPVVLTTGELNGMKGIVEQDFLKSWGVIYFTAEYGNQKHRVTFDRSMLESLFVAERPKPRAPHVTQRAQP